MIKRLEFSVKFVSNVSKHRAANTGMQFLCSLILCGGVFDKFRHLIYNNGNKELEYLSYSKYIILVYYINGKTMNGVMFIVGVVVFAINQP